MLSLLCIDRGRRSAGRRANQRREGPSVWCDGCWHRQRPTKPPAGRRLCIHRNRHPFLSSTRWNFLLSAEQSYRLGRCTVNSLTTLCLKKHATTSSTTGWTRIVCFQHLWHTYYQEYRPLTNVFIFPPHLFRALTLVLYRGKLSRPIKENHEKVHRKMWFWLKISICQSSIVHEGCWVNCLTRVGNLEAWQSAEENPQHGYNWLATRQR